MDPARPHGTPRAAAEGPRDAAAATDRIPPASSEQLEEAYRCLLDESLERARELLDDLDRRHPDHVFVLEALLELHWQEDDHGGYFAAARRLLRLEPDEPQSYLRLAGCLERQGALAASLWYFRRYLQLAAASDPLVDQVRKSTKRMEPRVAERLRQADLPEDAALDCLALYEQVSLAADTGQLDLMLELTRELVTRWPDFVPGWNQLSRCWFLRGNCPRARSLAEEILRRDPGNPQARADLARYRERG